MAKCTTQKRIGHGVSSTRPSIRNSRRYFLTSPIEVESGEPRLTSKTPLLMQLKFVSMPNAFQLVPQHCSQTQLNHPAKHRRDNDRQEKVRRLWLRFHSSNRGNGRSPHCIAESRAAKSGDARTPACL